MLSVQGCLMCMLSGKFISFFQKPIPTSIAACKQHFDRFNATGKPRSAVFCYLFLFVCFPRSSNEKTNIEENTWSLLQVLLCHLGFGTLEKRVEQIRSTSIPLKAWMDHSRNLLVPFTWCFTSCLVFILCSPLTVTAGTKPQTWQ